MTAKPYCPQQDIADLMRQYYQEVKTSPEMPDEATRLLRARLVFEEALEFVRACGCTVALDSDAAVMDRISVQPDASVAPDLVEYVDGCVDQLVVTYGALNAAGVQVQPAWDEVQRSNMSKAWPHCSRCDAVLELGAGGQLVHSASATAHAEPWTPVLRIHKREDGKVVKSPTYSPADIRRVIAEQQQS
jgi:predicted HAD superfamily Cof-like phosphohydrolase